MIVADVCVFVCVCVCVCVYMRESVYTRIYLCACACVAGVDICVSLYVPAVDRIALSVDYAQ